MDLIVLAWGLFRFLFILLWIRITTSIQNQLRVSHNVAIELSKEITVRGIMWIHMDEMGRLNSTINILARNLQEMVKAKEMQQDRLSVLIENIGAGLILN